MRENKLQQKTIKTKQKESKLKITSEPKVMLNKSFFQVKDLLPPNDHEYYKKKEQQLSKVLPSLFSSDRPQQKNSKEKYSPKYSPKQQNAETNNEEDEKFLEQQSKNKLRLFMASGETKPKRRISEIQESAFICPICLDESTNNIYISKCQHKAHLQCWEKWLETKLECPLCKSRVRKKQLAKDDAKK